MVRVELPRRLVVPLRQCHGSAQRLRRPLLNQPLQHSGLVHSITAEPCVVHVTCVTRARLNPVCHLPLHLYTIPARACKTWSSSALCHARRHLAHAASAAPPVCARYAMVCVQPTVPNSSAVNAYRCTPLQLLPRRRIYAAALLLLPRHAAHRHLPAFGVRCYIPMYKPVR